MTSVALKTHLRSPLMARLIPYLALFAGMLTLAGSTRIEPAESRNVVARLGGSDAMLSREFIAYTAHLDHIGVGAAVNGDSIYNGAMDNALGVSIMLVVDLLLFGAIRLGCKAAIALSKRI